MKQAPAQAPVASAVKTALTKPPPPAETNHDLVLLKPTPELNPRNKAMAEIAARSNAQADVDAAESVQSVDDDGNPVAAAPAVPDPDQTVDEPTPGDPADGTPPLAEPDVTPEVASAPAAVPAAAAPAIPAPQPAPDWIDPNADYELIVDGKPLKVKGAQIVDHGRRALQKETTADYRLQLATQTLEEAKRIAAQLKPAPEAPAAPAALDEASLAQMIQFGTPEQAAEAVKALRTQRPDTVTKDGLQQFLTTNLPAVVDAQLAFREAANHAKKEYGDLLADPYLSQLWYMKEDQMRKAGDVRAYGELYTAIGDDLRKHFNRPKPTTSLVPAPVAAAPTQQAAPTLAQRQAAKAAAPAAPRLAAARMEGGADVAKPKTREEIIEQMRKARGQDSLQRK